MKVNGITIIWDHEVEAYMDRLQRNENRRLALQHAVNTHNSELGYHNPVEIIDAAKKYEAYLNGHHLTLAPSRKPRADKGKKRR